MMMKARNLGCLLIAIAGMTMANTSHAQCGGSGGTAATGTTRTGATGTQSIVSGLSGASYATSGRVNAGAQMMYAKALSEQAWLRQNVYKQQLARKMRNESLKSDSDELLSTKKDRLFAQKSKSGKSAANTSAEKFVSK
jgi:hypothetical protein